MTHNGLVISRVTSEYLSECQSVEQEIYVRNCKASWPQVVIWISGHVMTLPICQHPRKMCQHKAHRIWTVTPTPPLQSLKLHTSKMGHFLIWKIL